ncbi:hypoxanthine phosphoribosyltransferase [Clostridium sartagoforme AAU1]|uniref:Hypoxanthine phosphoribosyltransferase n=1 Tax=Clostridium sartagoforme AAU1 TaxID=1202534 RepID=R9CCE8_9CLOT|nr:hypoxanthine phosphoribosyltransferase [Clostridium sartagoforme AAU1]
MIRDIKKILLTEDQISKKVKELGSKISEDYKNKNLLVVGILKGSVLFASDLIKSITIPCEIDFMAVSSYGSSTETSGVVRILKDLDHSIEGKDIIIVEDIIDSGVTLDYLLKYLRTRKANSIEIITLLTKLLEEK